MEKGPYMKSSSSSPSSSPSTPSSSSSSSPPCNSDGGSEDPGHVANHEAAKQLKQEGAWFIILILILITKTAIFFAVHFFGADFEVKLGVKFRFREPQICCKNHSSVVVEIDGTREIGRALAALRYIARLFAC